ncbi:Rhodocoxin reductase [Pseudooceanicola marinus]|uniref:Rhodocoxin reductase n=1 Tax=Pseudooceanicola marinus TaxID=396013 RepID=A0A1X6YGR2_9RHOB|nr:FAD-dependent oxidoreductase [Pseudooceanicola marinus]PJE32919.1 pyridine nucleotide-disulfide oxidoreductase [Pseudooceanicola marinus]SLN19000.1 Rhodocoxin reductase [Pseudooceanicola marinus]
MNQVVIIGSGQAGVDCAFGLRQQGHAGQITLVGDDPELPYQRPPLSKDVLKSRGEAGWLPLRGEALYTKQDISLQLGQQVREIRRADRQVILEDGSTLPYDQLILATGARNRLPPLPGLAEATPMALRNAADTRRLIAALPDMDRLAIIGGGFIGLETAAALHGSSTEVTLYEAAPRLMSRSVSPELSDWFRRFHEARGTIIRTEARIEEVLPGQLRLSDGEIQAHDALLLAAGVMPNVELAADAGLEIGNGICTDATHATSDPAIFAIGDCAEAPNPFSPAPVRLESVACASEQARRVAAILTGKTPPPQGPPWFWSNQGNARLQIAGLARPDDATEVEGDLQDISDTATLTIRRYRDGSLTAVETVNQARVHMQARKTLSEAMETSGRGQ